MRGFLGGVSVGALLAAGGLAMLSLSVPLPEQAAQPEPVPEPAEENAAQVPEPDAAAGIPDPVAHDPGEAPQMPNGAAKETDVPENDQVRDADLAEVQPEAPGAGAAGDDLSALAETDTSPAEKPAVGLLPATEEAGTLAPPAAPEALETSAGRQPQAVQPAPPAAPGNENAVVAATEPALEPDDSSAGEDSAAAEPPEPEPAPKTVAAPDSSAVQAPDIGSAPQAITLPVIGAAPAVPAGSAGNGAETGAAAGDTAGGTEAADPAPLTPGIGTPVVPLTERDKQETGFPASGSRPDMTPFTANSEPFFNPEDRPLMSIVLIDDAGAIGAEALAEFPYPLSFAIDPDDPDAAAKMAARREAGFEVLMLADLPRQASPQDAETALEVWRGKLPEAVAILEGVETGVQGNRPLADQVAAVAASAGYGLVTQDSGLNTVQKLALRDGVPAGVVFRDFDGAGQDPRAIRRFLDQAAFRAGQEGAVIMLGRLRPDTITALLLWGLQDRAERVALAPVSASLESLLPAK